MKIEILQNNEGYIYLENQEKCNLGDYKILSHEEIGDIKIYHVKDLVSKEKEKTHPSLFYTCKHGHKINHKTLNLLPSEDWQELVSCWSCHCNEFASVKDLKIKVRPGGILVSSFFLLINNEDLPECCQSNQNIRKVWFNELKGVNHKQIIYEYLDTHFKTNNIVIFKYKEKTYEIKYFYTCKSIKISNEEYTHAMKIGIKEKPDLYYKPQSNDFVNEFYLDLIYQQIHYLNINILEYKTGFIYF